MCTVTCYNDILTRGADRANHNAESAGLLSMKIHMRKCRVPRALRPLKPCIQSTPTRLLLQANPSAPEATTIATLVQTHAVLRVVLRVFVAANAPKTNDECLDGVERPRDEDRVLVHCQLPFLAARRSGLTWNRLYIVMASPASRSRGSLSQLSPAAVSWSLNQGRYA